VASSSDTGSKDKPKSTSTSPKKKTTKIETEPDLMKTYLRIPFERAIEDPSWMSKKKAGRKLSPIEAEEFFQAKYEKEFLALEKETSYQGIPSHAQLIQIIRSYHVFKKSCLMSFYDC
jgi:hypothetical protein